MSHHDDVPENINAISRRNFLKASAIVGSSAVALFRGMTPFQQFDPESEIELGQNDDSGEQIEQLSESYDVNTREAALVKAREFAILPWMPILTQNDRALAKSMRACGFNLAFTDVRGIKAAHRAGLQVIIWQPDMHPKWLLGLPESEIRQRVRKLVKQVRAATDGKGVFGYCLADEPKPEWLPQLKPWVDAFREADPQAFLYTNLLPYHDKSENEEAYLQYLEDYVQILQPESISYDFYGLTEYEFLPIYFWNLENVRRIAFKHGLPFWNTVLSNAHGAFHEPTDTWLRFQFFTTLAYGARGISWFTYQDPQQSNFRLSPVDPFGNVTPTWHMLRYINLQLQRILPVYLTLEHRNTFHFPATPYGTSGIETSLWVWNVDLLPNVNVCVGEFIGPRGEPFLMIVNTDLQYSTWLRLNFKPSGQLYWVNPFSGNVDEIDMKKIDSYLAPGQGILLKIA